MLRILPLLLVAQAFSSCDRPNPAVVVRPQAAPVPPTPQPYTFEVHAESNGEQVIFRMDHATGDLVRFAIKRIPNTEEFTINYLDVEKGETLFYRSKPWVVPSSQVQQSH